ncbi:VanZ family protein [Halorubrum sp. JWXQ-INN 858]|uniref:VanZ family protein n=1 Tax=Halorubrum sp. JWXQ-INN 858 TaxID=2690782 RepID=UPI001359B986|nr:VanZ family protein [Halorubrum sp. JWXQ-INN 858]MWV65253.1 VanZ family protein [Halorubrum sp. JWXQ-INN 858]
MRRLRLPLVPKPLRWGVVLAVAGTILYYSILTPPGSGTFRTGPLGLIPFSDWLHFLAYGGLAATLAYALHDSPRTDRQVLVLVFVVAFGYGAAIELLQATIPSRTFDVADMAVNALGAAIAVGCWRVLSRYARFYRAARPTDLEAPIESP